MSPETDLTEAVCRLVRRRLATHEGLFVLGISGAQGSGKSTLARAVADRLTGEGIAAHVLSIDDLYLSRAARQQLAARIDPLFATRGVAGTHDVAQGLSVLDALHTHSPVLLPRFDKASDELCDQGDWVSVNQPCRVLIFEGWCVGAAPQPDAALVEPVNALERDEDAQGIWRRYVNDQLRGDYQQLFARIDAQVFLAAPGFSVVKNWRLEQERDIAGQGHAVMDEAAIARFIQFYQRITGWMLETMPRKADLVARLDQERRVIELV